jgi:hypothetical protein
VGMCVLTSQCNDGNGCDNSTGLCKM